MKNRTIEVIARVVTAIGFFAGCYLVYIIIQTVLIPMGLDLHKPVKGGKDAVLTAILIGGSLIVASITALTAGFLWFLFIAKVHHVPKSQLEGLTADVIRRDPREKVMSGVYKWMFKKIYG